MRLQQHFGDPGRAGGVAVNAEDILAPPAMPPREKVIKFRSVSAVSRLVRFLRARLAVAEPGVVADGIAGTPFHVFPILALHAEYQGFFRRPGQLRRAPRRDLHRTGTGPPNGLCDGGWSARRHPGGTIPAIGHCTDLVRRKVCPRRFEPRAEIGVHVERAARLDAATE